MATINLKLKRDDQQESTLLVNLKLNGKKVTIYTGQTVLVEHFSITKQECKKEHPNAGEINSYLHKWKSSLEKQMLNWKEEGVFVTKALIDQFLDQKFNPKKEEKDDIKGLLAYFDYLVKMRSSRWSKSWLTIVQQTKRILMLSQNLITKKMFEEFNAVAYNKKSTFDLRPKHDIAWHLVNYDLFESFSKYVFDEEYKVNTIGKQINCLKYVVRAAQRSKFVSEFDLECIEEPSEQSDQIYCNFKEIIQFIQLKLEDKEEEEIRDLFVFGCFFGQRISELTNLDVNKFTKEGDDIVFNTKQKKTGIPIEFVLDKVATKVYKKYKGKLPQVTEQRFNKKIKLLALRCPLMHELFQKTETFGKRVVTSYIPKYKLISSHTMRRSFCTNYFKLKVNTSVIMAISGHSSENQLKEYIKAFIDKEDIKKETAKAPDLYEMAGVAI